MSLPTYAEVAKRLDIPRCRGLRPNGQRCYENHEGTGMPDAIHWRDRRPTRSGIREFLTLAALRLQVTDDPYWRRYYRAQMQVFDWSVKLGVRFPSSVAAMYRARLKAMIANVSPNEELREEAYRWSTRT